MTLEELLEKYVEYNNRADPAEIAAFNKIKEEIGEHIADIAVAEKFGLEAQARAVPRRGVKGAPVLDRVYELAPGKYLYAEEGAFIIADAKFGESDLARSNFNRRFLVEGGKMTPVPARFQITQLDPDWIRERIREVAAREAKAAAQQGVALQSSLADDLDRAARENRLRIIEVRGSLDLQNRQVVGINGEIVDHTQEFYDRYLSGRRPPIDKEGRLARQESLHRLYLNRAAIKARGDATALEKARKKLERAKGKLQKVQEKLPEAKGAKRKKLRKELEGKRADVETAKREFQAAKKEAKTSEPIRQYHEEAADETARLRAREQAKKEFQRKNAPPPRTHEVTRPSTGAAGVDKPPATGAQTAASDEGLADSGRAGTAVSDPARAIEHTGVSDRAGAGGQSAAAKLAKGAEVVEQGGRELAKVSRLRPVARLFLKGARVGAKIGRFVFFVLDVANPILDLLLMVDIVDAFVAWLQREKVAEQAEWRRIAHFLSAHSTTVPLAPFNLPYYVGLGDTASQLAQLELMTDAGPGNFLAWFQKWDTEHAWSGFVYATANVELQRQEVVGGDDPYPVTYYLAGVLIVSTSSKPQPNWKEQGPSVLAGPGDDRNYRTAGRPAPVTDPKYNVSVNISSLKVRYTYPNPILSPFEFILAKSNSLIGDIVAFLSKYDDRIFRDMDVRVEIVPDVVKVNLLAEVDFQYPLYGPAIKWCLQALFNANDLLAKHAPEKGDGRLPNPPQKYNEGFYRRLNILRLLSAAPGPKSGSFHQIALQMREILRDENPRHLLLTRDKDLDGITIHYLQDAAMDIHADVQRAYAACRKPPSNLEFNYEGPPA